MKNYIFILSIFLLIPSTTFSTPIFGDNASATGSFRGDLNSVLGPHDNRFIQIGHGTSVTVNFATGFSALADGTPADDLRVHTFDLPTPVEGEIAISADGSIFTTLGFFSDANPGNVIDFDLDALGFTHVAAVRITDFSRTSVGFDLDAIEGFNGGPIPAPVPEPASILLLLTGSLFLIRKSK